jgi:NADH-quinone oxidoreductase subunit E
MSDQPLLSEHTISEIEGWLARFPADQRQSAVLGALRAAQHQNDGYLSDELIAAVAAYLGMSKIAVLEVASFYSMLETQPCGRHSVAICTNISCWLRGGEELVAHAENKLGIKLGESTPDGRIFLKREEECLAGCCGAPMMQVDHVYHTDLDPAKLDEILDGLE